MEKEVSLSYQAPSLESSWKALKSHISTYLSIYLVILIVGTVSFLINLLFIVIFGALGDGSETATSLGQLLGTIITFPLSILNNLFGVLLIAVPAIYYANEEVVSFKRIIKKHKR